MWLLNSFQLTNILGFFYTILFKMSISFSIEIISELYVTLGYTLQSLHSLLFTIDDF